MNTKHKDYLKDQSKFIKKFLSDNRLFKIYDYPKWYRLFFKQNK